MSPLLEAFNSGFLQGKPGSIKSLSACLCTAAAHDTACSGSLSAAQLLWVVHKPEMAHSPKGNNRASSFPYSMAPVLRAGDAVLRL